MNLVGNKVKLMSKFIAFVMCMFLTSCPGDIEPPIDNGDNNSNESNSGGVGSTSSNELPNNIRDKYLHLIRSDGQTLVVKHLNNSDALIDNQTYISYKDGYAPQYSYVKKSKTIAEYNLMWTPLSWISTTQPSDIGFRHFTELTLKYETLSQGSFEGTTWVEGWSNDFTPIRENETAIKGIYYLGGQKLPDDFGENNSETTDSKSKVNKVEIISATKTSDSSLNISFIIDVEGTYDEAGIFVKSFESSLDSFGFGLELSGIINASLSGNDTEHIKNFKSLCPERRKVAPSSEPQSIKIENLNLGKFNKVYAYVIVRNEIRCVSHDVK